MEETKHFFVSYSHLDDDFALKLAADLKNIGISIWIDRFDGIGLSPSDDWRKTIEMAITEDNANALIPVISPNYINSKYCMKEIARADRLDIPIIPVLLQDIEDDSWPLEIEREQYADFSNWTNKNNYGIEFDKLKSTISEKNSKEILHKPGRERVYINSLIADLESRRGIKEYIDLKFSVEDFDTRINMPEEDEWGYTVLRQEGKELDANPHYQNIRSVLKDLNQFVLIGEPGAGKTTTLRKLALETARSRLDDRASNPLPLMIYLSQWDGDKPFVDFIGETTPFLVGINNLIDSGYILLFLDGLNEMGKNATKNLRNLNQWLNDRSKDAKIIISCRKGDYSGEFIFENLSLVSIDRLTKHQISSFVKKYLDDRADSFLSQVLPSGIDKHEDERGFISILRNPYLLTALMIVYIHSETGKLTRNTGKLFDRLISALWKREELRGLTNMGLEKVKNELARLAFSMINSDMPTEVPLSYATFYVSDYLILEKGRNANLVVIKEDKIRFYHQLIQEYFAAIGLSVVGVSHIDFEKRISKYPLPEYFSRNKWDQVIITLCGIVSDPVEILKRVIRYDPSLGVDCLESVPEIDYADVMEYFVKSAHSDNKNIRKSGVVALGRIGDESVFEVLFSRLDDEDTRIRRGAVDALANLGEDIFPRLQESIEDSGGRKLDLIIDAITKIKSGKRIKVLIDLTNHERKEVRLSAIKGLGKVDEPETLEKITILLEKKEIDYDEKMATIYALGHSQKEYATSRLIRFLEDDNLKVRIGAYDSIKRQSGSLEYFEETKPFYNLNRKIKSKKRIGAINSIYSRYGFLGLLLAIIKCPRGFWGLTHKINEITNHNNVNKLCWYVEEYGSADLAGYRLQAMLAEIVRKGRYQSLGEKIENQLNNTKPFVIGLTIRAVAEINYNPAAFKLIELLNDRRKIYSNSNKLICDEAAVALIDLGERGLYPHIKDWAKKEIRGRVYRHRNPILDVIGEIGDDSFIPRLKEIAGYKDNRISRRAERAIESIEHRTTLET